MTHLPHLNYGIAAAFLLGSISLAVAAGGGAGGGGGAAGAAASGASTSGTSLGAGAAGSGVGTSAAPSTFTIPNALNSNTNATGRRLRTNGLSCGPASASAPVRSPGSTSGVEPGATTGSAISGNVNRGLNGTTDSASATLESSTGMSANGC
jgi:hypothetical protein